MMTTFHLVESSMYPIMNSFIAMGVLSNLMLWFQGSSFFISQLFLEVAMILVLVQWWRDVNRESMGQGFHTHKVVLGVKIGFAIFILSEVMFFASFFWGFFHSSLIPAMNMSGMWPPKGIVALDPISVPLLNTVILLSSGFTVTASHHYLLAGNFKLAKLYLMLTIFLGVIFTSLQGMEYMESSYTISDSAYGSFFFMMTGFHGLHVLIGTMFLIVCAFRMFNNQFSIIHHAGFEVSAWYWHFVDVVWLFLFCFVYLWAS